MTETKAPDGISIEMMMSYRELQTDHLVWLLSDLNTQVTEMVARRKFVEYVLIGRLKDRGAERHVATVTDGGDSIELDLTLEYSYEYDDSILEELIHDERRYDRFVRDGVVVPAHTDYIEVNTKWNHRKLGSVKKEGDEEKSIVERARVRKNPDNPRVKIAAKNITALEGNDA